MRAALVRRLELVDRGIQIPMPRERADPLKVWGDVLVKQGKIRERRAKYEDALRYAPNWAQLKEARACDAGCTFRRTENPRVSGSIPPLATIKTRNLRRAGIASAADVSIWFPLDRGA